MIFLNTVAILVFLVPLLCFCAGLGPAVKATKGEIWPKPQIEKKGAQVFSLEPESFQFHIKEKNCTILWKAVQRYQQYLQQLKGLLIETNNITQTRLEKIHNLDVYLLKSCEEWPYFEMDESYNLTVSTDSKLTSNTVWGVLRGLESFLQSFYYTEDFTDILIISTEITDFPTYAHRGMLLDTSRHYISVDNILLLLDALAMNKYNVFHWSIVNDPSFPYQSEVFPELSAKGAYDQRLVYTTQMIDKVVQYARERGIRVIPEFDLPGHTCSWHPSHPELILQRGSYCGINPIKEDTYTMLGKLFKEIRNRFPDNCTHFGGDEFDYSIWEKDDEIRKYAKEHNIDMNPHPNGGLFSYFMNKTIPLLGNNTLIVYQDVIDANVYMPPSTLVQVWGWTWAEEMRKVLEKDYRVLFSSLWYMDTYLLNTAKHGYQYYFDSMYQADPRGIVDAVGVSRELQNNIVGGEAAIWTENFSDSDFLVRAWPRSCAVAEVLWGTSMKPAKSIIKATEKKASAKKAAAIVDPSKKASAKVDSANIDSLKALLASNNVLGGIKDTIKRVSVKSQTLKKRPVPVEVKRRLEEHICRMERRGIPSETLNGPGFCVVKNNNI